MSTTPRTDDQKAARELATTQRQVAHEFAEQQRLRKPRTVPVTMTEATWGRLASMADHRGIKVAELVAQTLERLVSADPDQRALLNSELNAARRDGFRIPRRGATDV